MRLSKTILVLAALLGAIMLAACGSDDNKSSNTTTPAIIAPTSTSGAATAVTVNLGLVLTLTGPNAAFGQSQQKGAQLALDEINYQNAVPGVKFREGFEDDAGDRDRGIAAFKKLLDAEVNLIIGPTLSNTAQATDPLAQAKKVPVLGISNTAAGITDIGDYIFRDSLTEADVVPQTIAAVVSKFKPKSAALLFASDDSFSVSGADVMRAELKKANVNIVAEQKFSTNDTDFRTQLGIVRDQNPDVIVVSALLGPAGGIVTQSRALGLKQPIVGGNGFNTPQLIKNAGDASEGVIVGAAWNSSSTNQLSLDFIRKYKAKFSADPDQFAAQAYAGVYIVAQAAKSAKASTPNALRDELAKVKALKTVLGDFSFNGKRDAVHPAVVQVIKGGEFTVLP